MHRWPAACPCRCRFDADGVKVAVEDLPIVNALQGRTVRGVQLAVVHPDDGSRRTYRLYAAPVVNAEGEIIAATYAAEDLTCESSAAC